MKYDLAKLMNKNLNEIRKIALPPSHDTRGDPPRDDGTKSYFSDTKGRPSTSTGDGGCNIPIFVDIVLDTVGLVPAYGDAVDVINAARYIYCKQYFDAIVSAASVIIPVAIAARYVGRSGFIDYAVDFIIAYASKVKDPISGIMHPIRKMIDEAATLLRNHGVSDDTIDPVFKELDSIEKEIRLTYKRRMEDTNRFVVPDIAPRRYPTPIEQFENELKALETLSEIHGADNVVGHAKKVMRYEKGYYHLLEYLKGGSLDDLITNLKNPEYLKSLNNNQKDNLIQTLRNSKESLINVKKRIRESGVTHGDAHTGNFRFKDNPIESPQKPKIIDPAGYKRIEDIDPEYRKVYQERINESIELDFEDIDHAIEEIDEILFEL